MNKSQPLVSVPDYYSFQAWRDIALSCLRPDAVEWICRFALVFLYAYRLERDNMPKTNQKQASAYGVTFVTINLTEADQKKFAGWISGIVEEWPTLFSQLIADGYKVGVTWDDNNACFIASLTGKVEGEVNYNKCIVARSSEWHEALQLLHYKHLIVCAAGDWTKHQSAASWG